MNTIQSFWELYDRKVISPQAGKNQRIETKRAFYAGAFAYMQIMLNLPEDISDDAGIEIIEGLRQEIMAREDWDKI